MADRLRQQLQPVQANPTDRFRRQLGTLEPIIRALLSCNTPRSPIVKEKIQQAETIITTMPLELAETWTGKLTDWWVEFAFQQSAPALLMPREEELTMALPTAVYSQSSRFHRLLNGSSSAELPAKESKTSLPSSNGHSTVSISESAKENFEKPAKSVSTPSYVSPPALRENWIKGQKGSMSSSVARPEVSDLYQAPSRPASEAAQTEKEPSESDQPAEKSISKRSDDDSAPKPRKTVDSISYDFEGWGSAAEEPGSIKGQLPSRQSKSNGTSVAHEEPASVPEATPEAAAKTDPSEEAFLKEKARIDAILKQALEEESLAIYGRKPLPEPEKPAPKPKKPLEPVPADFNWSTPDPDYVPKVRKQKTKEEVLAKRTHVPGKEYNWE